MMLLLAVYCFWAAAVIDAVSSEYTAGGKGLTPVETSKSEPQPGKLTLQSAVAVFANKSQPTNTGSIVFSGLWSVNETFWNDDNQTDAGEISEWVTPKSSSTLPASVTAQMARIRHQRNRWYNMRSRKSVEQGSGYLNLNVSEGGRKAALSGLESNRFIHADGKNASPPNSVGSRSDSRMTTRPFYRLLASGTRRQLGLTSTLTPSGMRSEGQEKFVPILPTFNRTSASTTAPFLGGPTTGPGDAKTTAPKSTKGAPNLENKLRAWGDGMKRVSTSPEFAEGEAQELALSEQSDAELEDAIWPDDEQHPEDFLSAGDNGETKKDALDTNTKPDIDIVTKFLRIVESQHLLGENCTAGTDFNLGEGVVDRYAQERFRLEADIAVNRANWLTRLWKYSDLSSFTSQYLLHASVVSLVEMDEDIFAAGNCYDKHQYKDHSLYCPFAYRLPEGTVLAKDLAVEYKYLSNTSEWFYIARKNAERVIRNMTSLVKTYMMYAFNETAHTERFEDEILSVTYEDGKWSKPYFDCGGGNIWMMTYTVPFFGYNPNNGTYYFKGTSGIDIDLRRVDIDQCELPPGSTQLNIFAASDKCKPRTTKCIPIPGLGFRRGSYRCQCKDGYYFPDTYARVRYYNGTVVEEEYEKKLMGYSSLYDLPDTFECLPCPEGCDICEDDRPCIVSLNWVMRISILILEIIVICCLPAVALFTWKYGNVKVVRAASPALLRMIILGSFFIYCTTLVTYPRPNVVTCTLRIWLREIGFSFSYGALMLKTWRISVIFRVRSAKAVKITDWDLMKRLGIIVTIFTVLLGIRTLVSPPHVIVGKTADDLKAFLCQTDWWDHAFTAMEMVLLVWGIRLCIVVRKAPSEFNESRFISMAIYNEFLLSIFLNVSMLFLQSPANPDLMYIIMFSHTQLTTTLLLVLIFGSKAYLVLRGRGSKGEDSQHVTKPQAAKFLSKAKSSNSHLTPSALSSGGKIELTIPGLQHVTDPDIQAEFRRLYYELEQLKDKNLRLGNRHLAARISAMQDAARQEEMQGMANNAHGGQHKNSLTDKSAKNHPKTPQEEEDSESDSGGGGGGGGGGLGSLMFGSKGPKVNNVLACMTDKIVCATFSADPTAMMDDDEGNNGYPDTQDDNRETGLMGTRKSQDLEADGEGRNSLSASSGSTSSQAAPASRAPASALALAAAPLLSPNALSLTFSSGTRRPSRGYKSQVTSPCVDFLSEALLPRRFSVSAIRESTSAFLTMPYSADHHQTVQLLNRTGPKKSLSRHALLPVSNAHACEKAPSDVIQSSGPTSPAAECPCCSSSSDNLVPDPRPASAASSSSSCTSSLRSCNNMKLPLSASQLLQYPLSPDACLNGPADCTASPDTVISHFLTDAVDASVTSAHEATAVALPVLAQQPRLRYNSRGRPKTDDKERFTEEVTV